MSNEQDNESLRAIAESLGAARPLGMEDIPNFKGMRAKTLRRLLWQATTKLLSPWRKEVVLPDGRICHPTRGFRGGPLKTGLPLDVEMQYEKAKELYEGDKATGSEVLAAIEAAEKAERSWRHRLAALFFTRRPKSRTKAQQMVEKMTNWQRSRYSGATSPQGLRAQGIKSLTPKMQEQIARTCVNMPHWKAEFYGAKAR